MIAVFSSAPSLQAIRAQPAIPIAVVDATGNIVLPAYDVEEGPLPPPRLSAAEEHSRFGGHGGTDAEGNKILWGWQGMAKVRTCRDVFAM